MTIKDSLIKAIGLRIEAQKRPIKRKYGYLDAGTVQHKYKKRDGTIKIVEVPIRYQHKLDRSRYTGEILRELRKARGVGRPPKTAELSHVG